MKNALSPQQILLVAMIAVVGIGGACYYFLRSRGQDGAIVPIADQRGGPRSASAGEEGKQARPDLPAGVPRLTVPSRRR